MSESARNNGEKISVGVVMDPIGSIKPYKDSTFAMMLEAQRRGHELLYMEPADVELIGEETFGRMAPVEVRDNNDDWFSLGEQRQRPLAELDILLMRRDPPFDMDYIFLTYLLERAEQAGVLVVNKPQALRDANEKCFISWFPQCCVPMAITRRADTIRGFVSEHGLSVLKPLDGMGGESIFQLKPGDPNLNVVIETLTRNGREQVMVQRYIPEITQGDKRVLLVDGKPAPYALARYPGEGDFRGNLAKGGTGKAVPLSDRDYWLCEQVAPELRRRGILFAGLDVIGDWLSEINVTSPTCIRELDAAHGLNIAGDLFDAMESRLAKE
jgi:glutathione synthase